MRKKFYKTKRKINRQRERVKKSKKGGNFLHTIHKCQKGHKGIKKWKSTLACITGANFPKEGILNNPLLDSTERIFYPAVHGWQLTTGDSLTKPKDNFLKKCEKKRTLDPEHPVTRKDDITFGYKYIGTPSNKPGYIEHIKIPKSNKRFNCWEKRSIRRKHLFKLDLEHGEKCIHNYQCKSKLCESTLMGLKTGTCKG